MSLPRVAIVGRPNVGKSSLLNRLAGRRVAIVEPTAGVTRDRVIVRVEVADRSFDVIDTGGLGLVDEEKLKRHIESQIEVALQQADVVLFVVDGKEGSVPGDEMVARKVRKLDRPVLLVVNKVESRFDEFAVTDWLRYGFGDPHGISAKEGFGISDLCRAIVENLPAAEATESVDSEPLKFAVIGKRNSGKSTFINGLVGEDRVIVSEIPGTTRDAVDVTFEYGGREMMAIDTAGVRKKSSLQDAIELFSYARATDSIRRADLVIHMFDIREKISQVDKKVGHYCASHFKPVILVGNKIDTVEDLETERWDAYIRQQLAGQRYAPVSFMSALTSTNVEATLELLFELRDQASADLKTSELNEVLIEARRRLSPKSRTKIPRIYYANQIGKMPLTILIFVNEPKLFHGAYERYLHNVLRSHFDIDEVPIRLIFRERSRSPSHRQGADSDPTR